jgi:hypothetical protein
MTHHILSAMPTFTLESLVAERQWTAVSKTEKKPEGRQKASTNKEPRPSKDAR